MNDDGYAIDCSDGRADLSGILRLSSPQTYDTILEPVKTGISTAAAVYTVDISKLRFMNSSGITALSRLVLLARTHNKGLVIVGTDAIAWQKKTLGSLQRLYSRVDIRLV